MLNRSQFDQLRQTEIRSIDKSKLTDIQSVKIDTALPVVERLQHYVEADQKPLLFSV